MIKNRIPIVLQTFNRVEYTIQVISSIYTHILYPHSIIVIDNCSTDGTVDYLNFCKQHGFIDFLVLNNENKGIAEPKNQGLEIVKSEFETKYMIFSDNDIVPPFIREKGCTLEHIVTIMDNNLNIGMCGVDLDRANSPANQEWWWRLRQHPITIPEFAEISIGFWFSVFRYDDVKDFKFKCDSNYGKVDESIRNYLGLVKKKRIGILKGVFNGKETIPKVGLHLGWTEDSSKYPQYIAMKKQERFKSEQAWKQQGRQW
jgi:glycosyltransferase involved in cell wall biosynthesis